MIVWIQLAKVESPYPLACSQCGTRTKKAYGCFRFTNRGENKDGETVIEPEVFLEKVLCSSCFKPR